MRLRQGSAPPRLSKWGMHLQHVYIVRVNVCFGDPDFSRESGVLEGIKPKAIL